MNRPPNSKVNLDRAIQRLYGTGARFVEYRSIIANTIVGQFLPDGVVKGGSALKLRYGCLATRMTTDFDTAYRTNVDVFLEGGKNKNAGTKEASLKNLWKALEAANDGDTIHLAKGVYPGKIGSAGTVPARGDGFMRLFWLQAKSER